VPAAEGVAPVIQKHLKEIKEAGGARLAAMGPG
jgi:hypothetical protein